MSDLPVFAVCDVSDEELWAEVERRELVIQVGWVNPSIVTEVNGPEFREPYRGHILWERHWLYRWPVYGLRGGTTVAPATSIGGS